jgi:hypothetical protein
LLDDPAKGHERRAGSLTGAALQAEADDLLEAFVHLRKTLIDRIYRGESTSR